MEHPEKPLFDEVRGLRSELETSKERIAKIEEDYEQKVVNLERRCIIDERCEEKLKQWKQALNSKITFCLNLKEYSFFKSTFTENIYHVNKNFLPEDEASIYHDIDKKYFKGLIEIIRQGHNIKIMETPPQKVNFSSILDKNLKEDPNFISCLKNYFDNQIFLEVIKDFGLNYVYLGSSENLLESFTIFNTYACSSNLTKNVLTDIKNLANKNNRTGLFLGYSGNIDITLKEVIRTNKIVIRPYMATSDFGATNGASYVLISGSLDGTHWDLLATVPSTYGSSSNNYLCDVTFDSFASFKHLRFASTSSCNFSLSYVGFK